MKRLIALLRPLLVGLVLLTISLPVLSAQEKQAPCQSPEASQFDFWVGDWDLTWPDSGWGTNTITKDYDGCVITEHFADSSGSGFRGTSVSAYKPNLGKWQQTWVDNQGGYLAFTGGFHDGVMELRTDRLVKGELVPFRMRWFNITSDSLDWTWQKSEDGGATWKDLWQIHYKRRK